MLFYDHFYTMGKTHAVCEDYAIHSDSPVPHIIICDGCSSSGNTDVGARILAATAHHVVENSQHPLSYHDLGNQVIKQASVVAEKMRLPVSVLDATLMIASLQQDSIHVFVYGDGCILYTDQQNKIHTLEITFKHNAPYYLTYWLSTEDQVEYEKMGKEVLSIINSDKSDKNAPLFLSFDTPLIFEFPLKEYSLVAIASDGLASCMDNKNMKILPLSEIAPVFLDFKHFKGDFVTAHIATTLKAFANEDIFPMDDLSIGVFAYQTG